jgi:dTDP-glucose 4,6-dehydratase
VRILVTGGAGFIGSKFVIHALAQGHDVTVLDALTYAGLVENLDSRARFFYGSVCDVRLVDQLVAGADWVVHFAAETHVARSIVNNRVFFETDVIGTQTIAQAVVDHADTVKKFLHFSTSEVYGTAMLPSMCEDHPLNPMSPYAAAKAGADRLVYSYFKTYGIPVVIARSFNVYGPRQHPEKVIPRFICSALMGLPLTIHGDGSAIRDFVHVEDVRRAVMTLLEHGEVGEVYNIGTGEGRSVKQIAQDVIRLMEPRAGAITVADRPGQVDCHVCDWRKISRLGWHPQTQWHAGLKGTIEWYQQNPHWTRQMSMAMTDGHAIAEPVAAQ